MSISAVIYARSSLDCPLSAEEQVASLRTIAADNGWLVAKVFIDRPTTMNKGRDRRPGQMALLEAIRSGSVDRVMLNSIDRVGRTLAEFVGFVEMCRASSVALYLHEQRLDTATSNGLSIFDLTEMMALHLRQSRRETNSSWSSCGTCSIRSVWSASNLRLQGRESQAGVGGWQGRPSSGAAYRVIASIVQPD